MFVTKIFHEHKIVKHANSLIALMDLQNWYYFNTIPIQIEICQL